MNIGAVDQLATPISGTHLPGLADATRHLVIGAREFRLDEARNPTTRILLVARELLVRAALVALVNSWKGVTVVAEARTEGEALSQRHVSPDVVLVSLAGMPHLGWLAELSSALHVDRLVVLLGDQAQQFRFQIRQLAHCAFTNTTDPDTLRETIIGIAARA